MLSTLSGSASSLLPECRNSKRWIFDLFKNVRISDRYLPCISAYNLHHADFDPTHINKGEAPQHKDLF